MLFNRAIHPTALLVVTLVLMLLGLIVVASASVQYDRSVFDSDFLSTTFGRQVLFSAASAVVLLLAARFGGLIFASPRICLWGPRLLFAATTLALMAALLPAFAEAQRGSYRWLRLSIGGMDLTVQPSEPAKLAMVALLASFFSIGGSAVDSFRRRVLPAAAIVGVTVLLVGKEDFGTAVLLAGVGMAVMLAAGCRISHLAMLSGVGLTALAGLLFFVPYRRARLTAFADIWADPEGAGYQPIQSLTSIAQGHWFGQGLGGGIQKYGYLPESRTDFAFAVICEEMGFVGGMAVIGLFMVFVWLGLRTALLAVTRFERLLAFGLTGTIGLQAVMNIAVVTVVAPTTGISLPFISAGGSGLLTFCAASGVLVAIAARAAYARGARDLRTSRFDSRGETKKPEKALVF